MLFIKLPNNLYFINIYPNPKLNTYSNVKTIIIVGQCHKNEAILMCIHSCIPSRLIVSFSNSVAHHIQH